MNPDLLIWLILTIVFVIVPLFNPKNREKAKAEAEARQRKQQQELQRQMEARTTADTAGSAQGDFESKLEEARRRIQQALLEQSGAVPPAQPKPVAKPPAPKQPVRQPATSGRVASTTLTRTISGKPVSSQQQPAQAKPASRPGPRVDWQQSGIDWQAPPKKYGGNAGHISARASAERRKRLKSETTELQVTKAKPAKNYNAGRRKAAADTLFSRQGVLNGLIWHQVLSEPPHKRGPRRQISRLR